MKRLCIITTLILLSTCVFSQSSRYYYDKGIYYLKGADPSSYLAERGYEEFKKGEAAGEILSAEVLIWCKIEEVGTPQDLKGVAKLIEKWHKKSGFAAYCGALYYFPSKYKNHLLGLSHFSTPKGLMSIQGVNLLSTVSNFSKSLYYFDAAKDNLTLNLYDNFSGTTKRYHIAQALAYHEGEGGKQKDLPVAAYHAFRVCRYFGDSVPYDTYWLLDSYISEALYLAKNEDQLNSIVETIKGPGFRDSEGSLTDKIKDAKGRIRLAEEKNSNIWVESHLDYEPDVLVAEFNTLDAPMQKSVKEAYNRYYLIRMYNIKDIKTLKAIKENPLAAYNLKNLAEKKIQDIYKNEWSSEHWKDVCNSQSIAKLREYASNSMISLDYKKLAEERINSIIAEQTRVVETELEHAIDKYEAYYADRWPETESLIMLGSEFRDIYREGCIGLRSKKQELLDTVAALRERYPDVVVPSISLRLSWSDEIERSCLDLSAIIEKEESGLISPGDYSMFITTHPDFFPNYIQDGYAIASANALTNTSINSEIKAVKALPASPAAKALIKDLTKRSYLRKKK